MVFYKERGKDQRPNEKVIMEDFIAIKGIKALGNQFHNGKLKQVNWLTSLPYEVAKPAEAEDIDVVDEETIKGTEENNQEDDSRNQLIASFLHIFKNDISVTEHIDYSIWWLFNYFIFRFRENQQ